MNFTLKIWRQENAKAKGKFKPYKVTGISSDCSFLEMLDILNEKLINDKIELPVDPLAFDHDCREGICGMCSLYINGRPHGPEQGTTVCQLHMRKFKDGDTITIEPWRAKAFPVIKDLMVDRNAFDKIIQEGGYVSVKTGGVPDGNAIAIPKDNADLAMDAAACIGCGACVAACKNASAMLFVSAKVSQFALLPQGQPEAARRVKAMVAKMDELGFGNCTNTFACEAECPKNISVENIARMNREFLCAKVTHGERNQSGGGFG
jgi:succinate dehydrogenase / fumarate reductase iron-sulfur subunit